MNRLLQSARFAVNGIIYGLKTERNVQVWFGVAILTLVIAWILEVSRIDFLFIFFWMMAIGTSELLNTSIEKLSDRITLEKDEQIGRVKDLSAGATFIASIGALISCLVIFIPKILEKFDIHL